MCFGAAGTGFRAKRKSQKKEPPILHSTPSPLPPSPGSPRFLPPKNRHGAGKVRACWGIFRFSAGILSRDTNKYTYLGRSVLAEKRKKGVEVSAEMRKCGKAEKLSWALPRKCGNRGPKAKACLGGTTEAPNVRELTYSSRVSHPLLCTQALQRGWPSRMPWF